MRTECCAISAHFSFNPSSLLWCVHAQHVKANMTCYVPLECKSSTGVGKELNWKIVHELKDLAWFSEMAFRWIPGPSFVSEIISFKKILVFKTSCLFPIEKLSLVWLLVDVITYVLCHCSTNLWEETKHLFSLKVPVLRQKMDLFFPRHRGTTAPYPLNLIRFICWWDTLSIYV